MDEQHYGILECSCGKFHETFNGSPDMFNPELRLLVTMHKIQVLTEAAGLVFKFEEPYLADSFRIV